MLESFLSSTMQAIRTTLRSKVKDTPAYAYWFSNVMQLLVYMKKDSAGLSEATIDFQCQLSELLDDIYELLLQTSQQHLQHIILQALVDFETEKSTANIKYERNFFGYGKRQSFLKANPR
jgi:predicted transcriptional regulator